MQRWNSGAKALLAVGLLGVPALAADTVFTGPVGGTWDSDANWSQAGPDLTFGTADDVKVQPGVADAALILSGATANLTSTENILELQVGYPAAAADTVNGTARLNVGAGATLTTNGNSAGVRVGRSLDVGSAVGSSTGQIVQTGGAVVIAQGSNGLRLSAADSGNVADSLYRISGGSVRGGSGANGTLVSDLRVGATANVFGTAEFHVVGSAATSVRFLDVQVAANTSGTGNSVFHFSLDAGGVTPLVAEDELQFRATNGTFGNNLLQLDMIAAAPLADVTLIQADRLNTNGATNSFDIERFTGLAQGAPVVLTFGGYTYNYTLQYTDGADDGVLDASVRLAFVSRTGVPEPTSLALLGVGGVALLRRQRA